MQVQQVEYLTAILDLKSGYVVNRLNHFRQMDEPKSEICSFLISSYDKERTEKQLFAILYIEK